MQVPGHSGRGSAFSVVVVVDCVVVVVGGLVGRGGRVGCVLGGGCGLEGLLLPPEDR